MVATLRAIVELLGFVIVRSTVALATPMRSPTQRWQTADRPVERALLADLAMRYLSHLRDRHPTWTIHEVTAHLGEGPPSPLLAKLVAASGFTPPSSDPVDVELVVAKISAGVHCEYTIADETGLSITAVRAALEVAAGYGGIGYGQGAYGRSAAISDGHQPVLRKVSSMGQMSYRGGSYCLGKAYRGRIAHVLERWPVLHVRFADRPPLSLAARHLRSEAAT